MKEKKNRKAEKEKDDELYLMKNSGFSADCKQKNRLPYLESQADRETTFFQ